MSLPNIPPLEALGVCELCGLNLYEGMGPNMCGVHRRGLRRRGVKAWFFDLEAVMPADCPLHRSQWWTFLKEKTGNGGSS